MASNSRIDDLRKRLDRDPQSRLFAQLAEELRKEGDLAEAIQVAREGLKSHANYPSARLTLGRALMDTGDTQAAQRELEAAVQGAPDNILAQRLLAECLESEGKLEEAVARYRTTLALSAGDRQVAGKLEALEERIRAAARPAVPEAAIPVSEVESEMELEATYEPTSSFVVRPVDEDEDVFEAAAVDAPAPIPLVETSEEFELERPYDALAARVPVPMPALLPEDIAAAAGEPVPSLEPEPPVLEVSALEAEDAPVLEAEPLPEAVPAGAEVDLNSSTLAELYFNQGFTDQAIDVYRRLAEREPGNDRVQARLRELEALQRHLHTDQAPAPPAAAPDVPAADPAARRAALERTIARLEGLQAALRKG